MDRNLLSPTKEVSTIEYGKRFYKARHLPSIGYDPCPLLMEMISKENYSIYIYQIPLLAG